jgi:hypothetical protein
MAMKNRIANGFVAITATPIRDFVGVALPWPNTLAIQISRIRTVGLREPLMGMQVKNVGFLRTGMKIPKLHAVAKIAMVNIGRIRRILDQKGRIAIRPRGQ